LSEFYKDTLFGGGYYDNQHQQSAKGRCRKVKFRNKKIQS